MKTNKLPKVNTFILDEDLNQARYVNTKLLPCPFCGSNKILTAGTKNEVSGNIVYKVFCTDMDCMADVTCCLGKEDTAKESREKAVEKWNRRTSNN